MHSKIREADDASENFDINSMKITTSQGVWTASQWPKPRPDNRVQKVVFGDQLPLKISVIKYPKD